VYAPSTSNTVAVLIGDQRQIFPAAIGKYLNQRNNQILANEPSANRQIDRLVEAGAAADADAGWAPAAQSSLASGAASRLGAGGDAGSLNRARFGGARVGDTQSGSFGLGTGEAAIDPYVAGALFKRDYDTIEQQKRAAQFGLPLGLTGPITLSGLTGSQVSFSTSLRDVTRYVEGERNKAASELNFSGVAAPAAKMRVNPFDFWIDAKASSFFSSKGISSDGSFGLLSVGADYVFTPRVLAGLVIQFDSTKQTIGTINGSISGQGWMAGPYMTVRLSDKLFWQGRAAWGTSTNNFDSLLTSTDRFSTQRRLASTSLSGRWVDGPFTFRPAASVSYIEDNARSYNGIYDVTIPQVNSRLGQAKAGPEWSLNIPVSPDFMVEPRFGLQAIWNFAGGATSQGLAVGGEASQVPGVRGRTEVGVSAKTASGVILDASGSYDGIGLSGYSAITAKGTITVPLR
jgi:hypothetical protein